MPLMRLGICQKKILKKIMWVIGVQRRTVACNWRFDNLSRDVKSQVIVLVENFKRVTHCLLFILQPIYLHNLFPHTFSQSITSRGYQPVSLLTNQIAHQGFEIFNTSEDGFHTGCRNVSRKQQCFSGLQSPRWYFLVMLCYSGFKPFSLKKITSQFENFQPMLILPQPLMS